LRNEARQGYLQTSLPTSEPAMLRRARRSEQRPLADPEVLALLQDEPELLALADAIAATQALQRRRWPVVAAVAAVFVAAVVAGLLLVGGRQASLVDQALAAIGDGPVIHSVIERRAVDNVIVDLGTNAATPAVIQLESWFDERNDQLRVITRRQGQQVSDVVLRKALSSPTGLDRTAAGFLRVYRQALASGEAQARHKELVVQLSGMRAQVALDPAGKPRAFAAVGEPRETWTVTAYSSGPRRDDEFRLQKRPALPVSGRIVRSHSISTAEAERFLGHSLGRLRRSLGTLKLRTLRAQSLTSELSDGRRRQGRGIELLYGSHRRLVQLRLAKRPEPAYGYVEGRLTYSFNPLPSPDQVDLVPPSGRRGRPIWLGQAQVGGVYLTVRAPTRALLVAAVRELQVTG
jgi:hypothetical protein